MGTPRLPVPVPLHAPLSVPLDSNSVRARAPPAQRDYRTRGGATQKIYYGDLHILNLITVGTADEPTSRYGFIRIFSYFLLFSFQLHL